jgi:hypothetical protein
LLDDNAWHSHNLQEQPLPDTEQVVVEIAQAADLDLVGFYAAGPSAGFASSAPSAGTRPTASTSTSACSTKTARR